MEQSKRIDLLHLLEGNARLTHEQLADMLGETAEAVANAMAELEAEKVIVQHSAIVDWDKTGSDRVTALIEVKLTPQRDVGFDRLARRIARFAEVRSCYLMSGLYDLTVEVEAASLREVARFVSERLSTLEGVASTTTHFVLKRYKHDGVTFGDDQEDERLAVTP